jgi:hypothetical protein
MSRYDAGGDSLPHAIGLHRYFSAQLNLGIADIDLCTQTLFAASLISACLA